MAISGTISQDIKYPMVGDVVSMRVEGLTAGNRVRWRVTAAPNTSAAELWVDDELPENWLDAAPHDGCRFAPDVDGAYTLEAVEEICISYIPHYDGDGSTSLHPIEEWSTVTTETEIVYVGMAMKRTIGLAPHTAILRAWAHRGGSTDGVLTWWADRNRCPVITNPSSDIARVAMEGTELLAQLARIGGYGYTEQVDVVGVAGPSEFIYSPYSLHYLLLVAFNKHIGYTTNGIHGAADAANLMGAVAVPTDDATFIAYVNTFCTKYNTHIGLGAATHPHGADVTNVITSGAAATVVAAMNRLVELRADFGNHRVLHTTTGHNTPGDAIAASRMPHWSAPATTEWNTTIAAYLASCVAAYDHHLGELGSGAAYHAAADSDNTIETLTAFDQASLMTAVNDMAKCVSAHTQNMDSTTNTKASPAYHAIKDHGGNLAAVPRATDWASTVALLEKTAQTYVRHIDSDSGVGVWHGGSGHANGGDAFVQMYGAGLVNKLFLDALGSATLGGSGTALNSVKSMLTFGGFGKA
jgi:hypothetical protein